MSKTTRAEVQPQLLAAVDLYCLFFAGHIQFPTKKYSIVYFYRIYADVFVFAYVSVSYLMQNVSSLLQCETHLPDRHIQPGGAQSEKTFKQKQQSHMTNKH